MSALQLLFGGALFLATEQFAGTAGLLILSAILFALELIHDLGLYRPDRGVE